MQVESSQTDTLKSDSVAPVPSPDIAIPDTGITISPDSGFTEKKDSLPPVIKKDSLSAGTGKKAGVKASLPPSIKEKEVTVPVIDSAEQLPEMVRDSFGVTFQAVRSHSTDTVKMVMEERLSGSDKLPLHVRQAENNSWMIILFLAVFSVFAWIRVSYSKRLRQFFEAFLSNRHIRQIVREEFAFSHPSTIALFFIFLVTSSLLLTQANDYCHWNIFSSGDVPQESSGMLVFFKILFSLALFYLGKIVIIRLSAILFSAAEELREYLFNFLLFTNILGIVLLPLTLGLAFATSIPSRNILIFSGSLVLLAFLFRLAKCVYIGSLTTKISKLYIILYICTLEILPLFVVIKAFTGSN